MVTSPKVTCRSNAIPIKILMPFSQKYKDNLTIHACVWIYVHCVCVKHLVKTPVLWRPCSVKSPFLYKDLVQWGPHFVKTPLYETHTMKTPFHEGPPVKTPLCEDPALWRFCSAYWPHSCLCLRVERMKTKLGLGDPIFTHSSTVTGSTTVSASS